MRRRSDHVDIAPEHDTLTQGAAGGPQPGSETSWRNTPQSTVTLQVLNGALLLYLGLLLGTTLTTRASQLKLRRQAEERRRLNQEWLTIRTIHRQRGECPRCGSPLSEEEQPDDD
jgi:hypothetical protein